MKHQESLGKLRTTAGADDAGGIAYRADIDGLRAVAIVLVVLYHAGLGLPGGYIGVDVFFVISGYLITNILISAHDANRASFSDFYRRRVKRILPALVVVYAFCAGVGAMILLPVDLKELTASLAASAAFVSNIFFFSTSGYFDGPAFEKPLLHTWSLSVEEQFYVIWPLICFAILFKIGPKARAFATMALLAGSLALAQWTLTNDRNAAFYFPTTRAWELMAGALVALAPQIFVRLRGNQLISVAALATIFASAFILNSRSETPGIIVAPAVFAAAALLATGGNTLVGDLLSLRPMRFIGLISYSLYLWHWPILALAHYHLERRADTIESLALVGVAVLISALSWKYVEQPFRSPTFPRRGALALGLGALAAIGIASATFAFMSKPAAQEQSPVAQKAIADAADVHVNDKCHSQKVGPLNLSDECRIGAPSSTTPDFIVIGDSHGDHFSPALDIAGRQAGRSGFQITHGGCLPVWDIVQMTNNKPVADCERYRADVRHYVESLPKGRTIVMAARWSFYTETIGPNVDVPYFVIDGHSQEMSRRATRQNIEKHLGDTLDSLGRLGHRVVLIKQLPEYPFFPLNCYLRSSGRPDAATLCGASLTNLRPLMGPGDAILSRVAQKRPWVKLVSPAEFVCPSGDCRVSVNGVFLYRDLHHLNVRGSKALATIFTGAL